MKSKLIQTYIKKSVLLLADLIVIAATLPIALWLRLEQEYLGMFQGYFPKVIYISILSYGWSFYSLKTYRTIFRMANFYTATRLIGASLLGLTIFYLVSKYIAGIQGFPRSIFIIHFLLVVPACLLIRFYWRIFFRISNYFRNGTKTIIYGAGNTTNRFLPFLIQNKNENLKIIGIVDDDFSKNGTEIQGIKVYASRNIIPALKAKHNLELAILSMPNIGGAKTREIVNYLSSLNLKVKVLPSVENYINNVNQNNFNLRDLKIEDLLNRPTRSIDKELISKLIFGKSILVCGGGGSIGSELVRQIAAMKPRQIIINDASEYSLYKITDELRESNLDISIGAHLGDLSNRNYAADLFSRHDFDVIFHACAYKHVPLVEENICSAVINNLESARNVFSFAVANNVDKVVLISSDKAVRPTNIMGATKRICELLVLYFASENTKSSMSCVRFGNVLASSGSVIPKFLEQIKCGGPVTVTHPDITRYFMLINEAVSLVLQAATGTGTGDIFVLNMGEPIKIADMAKELIKLTESSFSDQIEIKFTGLRPGEKLFEELHLENEDIVPINEDYFKLSKLIKLKTNFFEQVEHIISHAQKGESDLVRKLVFELVREYEKNV